MTPAAQAFLPPGAATTKQEVMRLTLELAEQGQVTERYAKAIEQLASEKLVIHVGAI